MTRKRLPPEHEFQDKVMKKLKEIPETWWVKINDRTTSGIPDILGCVAGVFIAIELKTKSVVTPLQAYNLKKIDSAYGQGFVARPSNWKHVYEQILKIADLSPGKPNE